MNNSDADVSERFFGPATNSVALVHGSKGEFQCPLCSKTVKAWYKSFDDRRGTIYYKCEGCSESGHVSVHVPKDPRK